MMREHRAIAWQESGQIDLEDESIWTQYAAQAGRCVTRDRNARAKLAMSLVAGGKPRQPLREPVAEDGGRQGRRRSTSVGARDVLVAFWQAIEVAAVDDRQARRRPRAEARPGVLPGRWSHPAALPMRRLRRADAVRHRRRLPVDALRRGLSSRSRRASAPTWPIAITMSPAIASGRAWVSRGSIPRRSPAKSAPRSRRTSRRARSTSCPAPRRWRWVSTSATSRRCSARTCHPRSPTTSSAPAAPVAAPRWRRSC